MRDVNKISSINIPLLQLILKFTSLCAFSIINMTFAYRFLIFIFSNT